MSRFSSLTAFAPRCPATVAGLLAAEAELVRLTALHAAYAGQPNVTRIWQGYIDQKREAVECQRLTVEALTRARLDPDAGSRDPALTRPSDARFEYQMVPMVVTRGLAVQPLWTNGVTFRPR